MVLSGGGNFTCLKDIIMGQNNKTEKKMYWVLHSCVFEGVRAALKIICHFLQCNFVNGFYTLFTEGICMNQS